MSNDQATPTGTPPGGTGRLAQVIAPRGGLAVPEAPFVIEGIRGYLASFREARTAAGELHRRFGFAGEAGVWRLLTGAVRNLG
jgi:hypothetical protein